MFWGPLGPSLAPYIRSSPTLRKWVQPLANWYVSVSGYRRMGFRYDDLLVEESEDVQRALTRLTPREQYDRAFRMKRASVASINHKDLPKEEWTKPEEDVRYLKPHVQSVVLEETERAAWDTAAVTRK